MSNSKIATLTFHRAVNYGAVLQTYALQKSIEELGFNSEVLDYRSPFLETLHNPKDLSKYKSLIHYIYAVLKNRVKKDNRKAFCDFRDKYIKTSKEYDNESVLTSEEEYDAFVVGSDQVWNYKCTDFDKTYFLDFVKNSNKKHSYAASVGINLDDEAIADEYKRLLSDFNNLCVREEQGKAEIERLGLKADVCLDPTMLLNAEQWKSIAKKPKFYTGKYLLVYVIVETPSIFQTAKKIAQENNLNVIYINEFLLPQRAVKNVSKLTPEEWLWLFYNAEYIVTNSFHGTAFSVNFKKQFTVEPLPVKTNVNSRITDFLELFGLSDRVASTPYNINFDLIDYSSIDIEKQRNNSIDKLKSILSSIKGV